MASQRLYVWCNGVYAEVTDGAYFRSLSTFAPFILCLSLCLCQSLYFCCSVCLTASPFGAGIPAP